MRCFSVLESRVHEGILLAAPRAKEGDVLSIRLGNGSIPLEESWSNRLQELLVEVEILNADVAIEVTDIEDGEEVLCPHPWSDTSATTKKRVPTHLIPVPQRLDRDDRAMVLVRPNKGVDTYYSSTIFDECIDDGIIVRKYRLLGASLGVTICFTAGEHKDFLALLEPGASFRIWEEGEEGNKEFLVSWRDNVLTTYRQVRDITSRKAGIQPRRQRRRSA